MNCCQDISIVYEDDHLLAINKPAGLSSESGTSAHPSAETWAQAYLRRSHRRRHLYLRAVHRLDRPVSGVLLFAKNKVALRRLMAQFEARSVRKVYLAEVEGTLAVPSGRLEHFIGRSADGRSAIVREVPFEGGQPAHTEYRVLEERDGRTLLSLEAKTGRFHQLRAQLAHIGCPIVGDVRYGASAWRPNAIRLHAQYLHVQHPVAGVPLILEAPLPPF